MNTMPRPLGSTPPVADATTIRSKVTDVEIRGVETVPDRERTSTWLDLMRVQFGCANTFVTALLGSIAVALGLSFWQAVIAVVIGTVLGALVLSPMGLFGPRTGTNNAVSSGAFLGVRGRIVGSFLSLLTAVAFFSIAVWVGGDAIVGAVTRLFGVEDSLALRTTTYGIIALAVVIVVVYGFQFMLLINKIAVITNSILMLLGFLAFSGMFDAGYDPGPDAYALGSFWSTFVAAVLIIMTNPISLGAFLGDWARYIPRSAPTSRILGATFLAQGLTLSPFSSGSRQPPWSSGKSTTSSRSSRSLLRGTRRSWWSSQ